MDYYAKRLATCSSDKTIKIFDITGETQVQTSVLNGHDGPVWQVTWAHPMFGSLIASCGYDRKVIIWKERDDAKNNWYPVFEYTHTLSGKFIFCLSLTSINPFIVNSISWAPHEFGLILACGSTDSNVSIITFNKGSWSTETFKAHDGGVNAVSWKPYLPGENPVMTLVSGGCDNLIKIFSFHAETSQWKCETTLEGHNKVIRDVQWSPNIGLPYDTIASASQDGIVIIWNKKPTDSSWKSTTLELSEPVWRVSWSLTGNIIAITSGENNVTLWKETKENQWESIHSIGNE